MPIITLTTDFGIKDHFVGAVKGAILTELNDVTIVDISHEIAPFNITETAHIIKNSYKNFPINTIHVIGVDAELSTYNKHLAIELDNHFFICPDNGVISMIASEINPTKIVEITIHNTIQSSFPVLDVFVKVAAHIARGGKLDVIGKQINDYKKLIEVQPKVNTDKTAIKGEVIYIDNYGNVISNISKKLFAEIGKGREFVVSARSYKFSKIYNKYNETVDMSSENNLQQADGNKLALFNTSNLLEIAVFKGNPRAHGGAASLLGLDYRDTIMVEFKNTSSEF